MVAVVLACEPRSNHLWYHMFAADGLSGSYMTGFMVRTLFPLYYFFLVTKVTLHNLIKQEC